jgi:hypothetical protein
MKDGLKNKKQISIILAAGKLFWKHISNEQGVSGRFLF